MVHIHRLIVIEILFIQRRQLVQSLSVPLFLDIFCITTGIIITGVIITGYMPRMYTILLWCVVPCREAISTGNTVVVEKPIFLSPVTSGFSPARICFLKRTDSCSSLLISFFFILFSLTWVEKYSSKTTGRGCQTLLFGVWLSLVKRRTKSGQEQLVPCFRNAEIGI